MRLRVTRRVYGVGTPRRTRVLLAVPGKDYPWEHVVDATGGDRSLIDESDPSVTRFLDRKLGPAEPEPAKPTRRSRKAKSEGDAEQKAKTSKPAKAIDLTAGDLDVRKLTKPQLVELAGIRQIEIDPKATKPALVEIILSATTEEG